MSVQFVQYRALVMVQKVSSGAIVVRGGRGRRNHRLEPRAQFKISWKHRGFTAYDDSPSAHKFSRQSHPRGRYEIIRRPHVVAMKRQIYSIARRLRWCDETDDVLREADDRRCHRRGVFLGLGRVERRNRTQACKVEILHFCQQIPTADCIKNKGQWQTKVGIASVGLR